MKKFLIIIITKIITVILKILGKNAGNLPGNLALKWDKNIFEYFKIQGKIIAVTGTNGKTMTNNCIAQIFKNSGKKIVSNLQGNNMETGILSAFIKNSTITGKIKADYIILETDESYVPVIYKKIPLDCLIVLNFFRDQLDRNGEMETLILKIQKFLETYEGNLILNADDPNVSRLEKANTNNKNVYFYSIEKCEESTEKLSEAAEGTYCPFCRAKLEYEYYQYAHVGKFECPKCHYGKNEILEINNCKTVINLAKNPTGVNVSMRFLQKDQDAKELLFVLNDNIADGKDVSWIWDINFENLNNVERIITAGKRPYDIAIRIKTAGYPIEKIIPCENLKEAVNKLYETNNTKYIIANYTAIQNVRKLIFEKKEDGENNERN